MPLIFRDTPNVVSSQSIRSARKMIVNDGSLSIGAFDNAMRQSTVITSEPDAAIAGTTGAHHDIANHRTILFSIVSHYLTCFRIIY